MEKTYPVVSVPCHLCAVSSMFLFKSLHKVCIKFFLKKGGIWTGGTNFTICLGREKAGSIWNTVTTSYRQTWLPKK
jgi:hypothetical protein